MKKRSCFLLELHWFKMHHWQYHHHSKYCTLCRWQLFANADFIREGCFFFLSVPQNSSVPLKERIRKIMKNSLKLSLLFFNIQYFYWRFQMEFIHMSDYGIGLSSFSKVIYSSLLFCPCCWGCIRWYLMKSSSNL